MFTFNKLAMDLLIMICDSTNLVFLQLKLILKYYFMEF